MRSLARTVKRTTTFAMLTAGFAVGLSIAAAAQTTTHTTLKAETREVNGHTVATFSATVLDENGSPATGAVTLVDASSGHRTNLSSAALDSEGKAEIKLDGLTAGDHALSAVYNGDSSHAVSQSASVSVHPQATAATPDFTFAIAPTSLTLKAGQSGALVATVTPLNSFTGFISLSCSGTGQTTSLPVGVACTFAPANLQVVAPTTANPTGVATADLSVQTTAPAGQNGQNISPAHGTGSGSPLVLAVLLPGVIGIGYLSRRRKFFGSFLLLVAGAISLLGVSACSARYGYLHHPPTANNGTPTGSYTITVTAQTSNGVTATAHSTSLALTVN